MEINQRNLRHQGEKLHLLSPLALLTKGFSIVYDEKKKIVTDIDNVNIGDKVNIRLINGRINCLVEGKENIDGKR
jgi:exodeoxyribonuclease VII large subunit